MAKIKVLEMKIKHLAFIFLFTIISWPSILSSQNIPLKSSGIFRMPKGISEKDYVPFCVIFKVKDQFRPFCSKASIDIKEMKGFSEEVGIPYQSLINLYLRDCAATHRKLNLSWK